ncbi:MAG: adenosylcobinamide kinase / adenosylcobinamide-phosphate guanylyltransferase [Methylobacteriaceae bacterium]|jgi:adenosylcobinamide kinase/adenosylcobinamide-phosphate guanylyltransferase|nr:adenosylcobinamide kinase / adenosylcobinamide-phosphate guanylyltransferase [Methylobacteriaceae bacterium]
MAPLILVFGGARSGKSRHAERLICEYPPRWTYIATAEALDDEMGERIAQHRARRDERWQTLEAPRALADAVRNAPADQPLLIDCLTLWLSNRLLGDADLDQDMSGLSEMLALRTAATIVVANEVGLGIVPDNALARRFRDAAGKANQMLAAQADRVEFVAAGLALRLK